MENKNDNLKEFLKKQMSSEHLAMNEPELSLVNEARERVMARKKTIKQHSTFFTSISKLFNLEIKLYQGGLAAVIIALGVFFFAERSSNYKGKLVNEYASNTDTSNSYSVKSTMFLVKNFSSQIN